MAPEGKLGLGEREKGYMEIKGTPERKYLGPDILMTPISSSV